MQEICTYLSQHYRTSHTLSEMAARAHMSISHFSSEFKKYTGKTLVQYANDIRIEKAKELLQEPDIKIYDIADLVGYSTISYFNRVFKESVGISPSDFRRKVGLC
ncbi:helix-turn-helix transcriptional regulator [Marinicrinis sediminis]|uniref:Helix-turn-helix transcriptional regulator n=1 Tax=Marinicrinis sediminis TaxID=1652465 RepID=A0ABW5REW4_9BACL